MNHASGWFTYESKDTNQCFHRCKLLKTLTFDSDNAKPMSVTFHIDSECKEGDYIDRIEESPGQLLVGWKGDNLVMDLSYALEAKVLLVTGSRSIKDDKKVAAILNKLPFPIKMLIHGGAIGVDTSAGRWAASKAIPVEVVRPDFRTWPINKYRWKAYTQRDFAMVRAADTVVAIWDGISSGTKLTFEYAEKQGKLFNVNITKE